MLKQIRPKKYLISICRLDFNLTVNFVATVFALFATSSALYETGDVIELTPSNFKQLVLDSDDVWVVQFYAPWCSNSVRYEEVYKQLASELKDTVKVGAMDGHAYHTLAQSHGLDGYPTVKIFGTNKSIVINEDFYGPISAIKDAVMAEKAK